MFAGFVLQGYCQTAAIPAIQENVAARKVAPEDVPNVVTAQFNGKVKNMIPSWTDNGNTYMAAYKDTLNLGHVMTYDKNGSLLSTQDEQGRTSYPSPIERYHDKRFPGEKFTVWLITDPTQNKMYYFTRDKETLWFDPKGNIVNRSDNEKVKQP